MRVLVTGAGGMLGRAVTEHFEAAGTAVTAVPHDRLDVCDRDAVLQAVTTVRPDAVVHLAAWTAVDDCEHDPDRAFRVNALATRHVAEATRRAGAHLLYVSTDYVFDGTKDSPYHEWDAPRPLSVYGRSKLAGEQEAGREATVVRTSWLVGRHGANILKTILRLATERETISFVDDQRGHPTLADDLARMLHRLVAERRPGVFHVTNQGAVSWCDFARAVLEAAGHDPGRVQPITTAQLDPPRAAPRPANSVLDNAALRLGGVPVLPDFRDSLRQTIATLA